MIHTYYTSYSFVNPRQMFLISLCFYSMWQLRDSCSFHLVPVPSSSLDSCVSNLNAYMYHLGSLLSADSVLGGQGWHLRFCILISARWCQCCWFMGQTEKQGSEGLHHQLHLADEREKNMNHVGGFCGAGLEVTYIISAHMLLTRTQKMIAPNSWEAKKCQLVQEEEEAHLSILKFLPH